MDTISGNTTSAPLIGSKVIRDTHWADWFEVETGPQIQGFKSNQKPTASSLREAPDEVKNHL